MGSSVDEEARKHYTRIVMQEELRKLEILVENHFDDAKRQEQAILNAKVEHRVEDWEEEKVPTNYNEQLQTMLFHKREGANETCIDSDLFELGFGYRRSSFKHVRKHQRSD